MIRTKFLIGIIISLIVVGFAIISVVSYSTQSKLDNNNTEIIADKILDSITEKDMFPVNPSGSPTKIINYTASQKNNQIILSIVTEDTIPTHTKELSEYTTLGYAWFAKSYGDTFNSGPGHLKGFLTIQENGNVTKWNTSEVYVSILDESKICLDVQTKLESTVLISENTITVSTVPFIFDMSKESIFKTSSFKLIEDNDCGTGFALQIFDS